MLHGLSTIALQVLVIMKAPFDGSPFFLHVVSNTPLSANSSAFEWTPPATRGKDFKEAPCSIFLHVQYLFNIVNYS